LRAVEPLLRGAALLLRGELLLRAPAPARSRAEPPRGFDVPRPGFWERESFDTTRRYPARLNANVSTRRAGRETSQPASHETSHSARAEPITTPGAQDPRQSGAAPPLALPPPPPDRRHPLPDALASP